MGEHGAAGIWPGILAGLTVPGGGRAAAMADAEAAARFAARTSPALARRCFGPLAGTPFAAEAAHGSSLLNRFRRISGLRWAIAVGAAGIEVICLKGLGTAFALYDDPDLRAMADADLLVRRSDLQRLVAVLQKSGFRFAAEPGRSPWGFISDASFQPMLSADGAVNLDLHVHPDAWPLHCGLPTEAVFAAARSVATPEGSIRVPAPHHMLLLTASHAARDLFLASTVPAMIDAILLLRRDAQRIDWPAFAAIARAGRSLRPVQSFLALLAALGADAGAVPPALCRVPGGFGAGEFRRLVQAARVLYPDEAAGWLARLRRELLVAAEPGVALKRDLRRLIGLLHPGRGLPEELARR
ncbi:MAG TPA: nucleotidyltransferase family protein [Candidatus Sulfotelmatobacter sp.]|nr:nucleotidyltransferase family protein [Candidatus Sulfotelmatobacter sp.]